MNNQRIDQIKESLHGLDTRPETSYTNQEIVDNLVLLQQAMARGVFERTHAENLRDRDIMLHFEALTKEYGLDGTDTFHRFKTNMEELGYMIGTIKKGMKGEQLARNSLKLLICDKAVRILYNVQLEDADTQAEYDAIVLTPYGMFVVEVKNWNLGIQISPSGLMESCGSTGISYDLPGRMSTKEALLREHLQELFPTNYHSILLVPNERAHVYDNYHRIPVCCGGGLSYFIQDYAEGGKSISPEQIDKIADTLMAHHKEQRSLCPVKCEVLIEDYASLMAAIEEASEEQQELDACIPPKEDVSTAPGKEANRILDLPKWEKYAVLGVAVGLVAAIVPSAINALTKIKR